MPNYMTKKTYDRLHLRLKHLSQVESIALSKEIAVAREKGDLRENAEYEMAKQKQSLVMTEIGELKGKLIDVQFIEDLNVPGNRVSIATTVELRNLSDSETLVYTILGSEDSDVENGLISFQSPLARGLIGKQAGEEITVDLPGGAKRFKIVSIKPFKK